ncbi:hypothetical protein K438DRAFT_468628 [Mycena galopus ATCC 62051]|nr:hypothetical protein K438DRAFT_468628 [Mycena galopus ATCC 62051]
MLNSTPTAMKQPRSPTISSLDDQPEPTTGRSQNELKLDMRVEIGPHVWQFEDTTRISRMLSPKTPKADGKLDLLADYTCTVDEGWFEDAVDDAATALESSPPNWPSESKESSHYKPLAEFLNECVKHGGTALGGRRGQWCTHLHFVKYDKEMGDGIGNAHPVLGGVQDPNPPKVPADTLYWSPPDGSDERAQMLLPVEVKSDWLDMVSQAATYARCLFSANPSRTFALVLAYKHDRHELRFLIFHRGGLTTNTAVKLNEDSGRKEALRLIMTILLWSEPHHAGFLSTSNDFEYLIPQSSDNGEKSINTTVKKVLHDSECVRGTATRVSRLSCQSPDPTPAEAALLPVTQSTVVRRSRRLQATNVPSPTDTVSPVDTSSPPSNPAGKQQPTFETGNEIRQIYPRSKLKHDLKWTPPTEFTSGKGSLRNGAEAVLKSSWQIDSHKSIEREMYEAATGSFGTPVVLCSYEGVHPTGEPISNILFLPSQEEIAQTHWKLFSQEEPKSVEARSLCFTVSTTIGRSLVHAESSYQLCMALVDGVLGWLSLYQAGYMHRDISIGNVLLAARDWTPGSFALNLEGRMFAATLPPDADSLSTSSWLSRLKITDATLIPLAQDIENLAKTLKAKNPKCTAFATDGDMSIRWETYFQDPRHLELSGTPEFMSLTLHTAMIDDSPYLQSPVDDLESFFWLAVWAVLFNTHKDNQNGSQLETKWKAYLFGPEHHAIRVFAKTTLTAELRRSRENISWSPILREFHPLLNAWKSWRGLTNQNEPNSSSTTFIISRSKVSNVYCLFWKNTSTYCRRTALSRHNFLFFLSPFSISTRFLRFSRSSCIFFL